MKYCIYLLILGSLVSCARVESTYNEDYQISKILIGSWDYEIITHECAEYGFLGFRRNGKYTRSSESCLMADDSFNNYYYGWFVANGFLCFVGDEKQFNEVRGNGFSKEYCAWEIEKYNKSEILVHEHKWLKDSEGKTYNVIRIFKSKRA